MAAYELVIDLAGTQVEIDSCNLDLLRVQNQLARLRKDKQASEIHLQRLREYKGEQMLNAMNSMFYRRFVWLFGLNEWEEDE